MEELNPNDSESIESNEDSADQRKWRTGIFHSARLKLTGFYLLTIIVFSLVLTLTLRGLAGSTFDRAGRGDNGVVRDLIDDYYSAPIQPNYFQNYQSRQSQSIHHQLNEDVIIINIVALVVGGILSYWYAGKALRPIEEAHDAQARFASDASHELRTPLAALRLENEVFLHQKDPSLEESKELIKSNLEEAKRLEDLADSLLALTQYNNAQLTLKPTKLTSIVNTAIKNSSKLAKSKNIKIDKDVGNRVSILGHFESLVQLLTIIIDNAIKYSPKKSTIFIQAVKQEDSYHLSVRDEGPGISEDDLPHIFDRLFRGDRSRSSATPGYGLGLSLAKEIATANKASITARNYPSGGAQFVVSFSPSKV